MKILVLEPPPVSKFGNQRIFGGNGSNKSDFRKPPLDLMMISGYLRENGFDNTLLDANNSRMDLAHVKEAVRSLRPDLVFFSTSTCTIYSDVKVAMVAKEIDPSIVTVALGTHVMALPEETLRDSEGLDVAVYSPEWEATCLDIVRNSRDLRSAKGIYVMSPGGVYRTEPQPPVGNLDELGFPAHDKLDSTLYVDPTTKRPPKTMVQGQKACINNCSFCCQPAFFGALGLRQRSVGHVMEELRWVRKLGFREVMFNDATLTADGQWASELFEAMIAEGIDLAWNCSTRARSLSPGMARLMKRAGCHTVMIGLESANETVLQNIRKNVTPAELRRAVRWVKKAGMDPLVFSVIGFPGETKESVSETISFLKSLDASFITLGIAVPVPGTEFYDYVKDKAYLLTEDWSKFDPTKRPVFGYPWLSADEMAEYASYGLRQFYLRPSYIFKRLLSIRSLTEAGIYLKNFKGFLKRYVLPKKIYDH